MSVTKELGKIQSVEFGMGGYQDAMIGISFSLGGAGWGVSDFWGDWATDVTERTQWTHEQRCNRLGQTVWRVKKLLDESKAQTVSELKGKPIEATFVDMKLTGWRILKEVL